MKSRHMISSALQPAWLKLWVHRAWLGLCAIAASCCVLAPVAALQLSTALAPISIANAATSTPSKLAGNVAADDSSAGSLLTLGINDAVSVQVYGRPELNTTTYVADDGTIPIPLAGDVLVAGLSPAKAGQRIAAAFRKGKYLVDPQVTVLLTQFRGQQVSVLGAVRSPGRFVVDSKTTVLDAIAQAGGVTDKGADIAMLLRPDKNGKITRTSIDLKGLGQDNSPALMLTLRNGDSIFMPVADQFYINGEVKSPSVYRLEPGMTVLQAIALGGGVTPRGSSNRIEISRRKPDGSYMAHDGKLSDAVQANDVIRVKERFF